MVNQSADQVKTKKERRMAESHAPPLQMIQFVVYLRDHLLLESILDTLIIKRSSRIFNRGLQHLINARRGVSNEQFDDLFPAAPETTGRLVRSSNFLTKRGVDSVSAGI
jgi:hypothetical protein